MRLEPPIREDAAVDGRVQRLHAPVEDLREAGDGAHVGHRQARVPQRARRAAGGDQLEPPRRRSPRPSSASPVLSLTDSSARRGAGSARSRRRDVTRACAAHRPRARPASRRATARGSSRCSTALIRSWRRRLVVAASDRDRLLEHDRAAVERRVDEVDRAAGDLGAVLERVADGVAAGNAGSSDGCVLRIRPWNAAERRGADEPHVAGEGDDVDRGGRSVARVPSAAPSSASRPGRQQRVSIPCSAAQASAGHSRSAKTRVTSPPSSPRRAAATSACRLLPAPETPTATRRHRAATAPLRNAVSDRGSSGPSA